MDSFEVVDGEVDEIVEALSLFKGGDERFRKILAEHEAFGQEARTAEILWTDIIDVFPVFGKSFGRGLQQVFAYDGEDRLELLRFHDGAIFLDLVEDALPYGLYHGGGETYGAGSEETVVWLDMQIVAVSH